MKFAQLKEIVDNIKDFATKKGWVFVSLSEYYFFFSKHTSLQFLDGEGELKEYVLNDKGKIIYEHLKHRPIDID